MDALGVATVGLTRNVIRTGANNFIEMEDTKGQEWIHTSTPNKNTHIHMGEPREYEGAEAHLAESTDGNAWVFAGGDRRVVVVGNHRIHVHGNEDEEYEKKKTERVGGDVIEQYEGDWNTHTSGHRMYIVDRGVEDFISAGWGQTVSGGWEQQISGQWKQTITGPWVQGVDSIIQSVMGGLTQTVGGPATMMHGAQNLTVSGATNWTLGGGVMLMTPTATMLGASWKQLGASTHTQFGNKTAVGNFDGTFTGIKIGINGLSVAINTLMSLSTAAVKVDVCGFKLANRGINLVSNGPNVQQNQIDVFT